MIRSARFRFVGVGRLDSQLLAAVWYCLIAVCVSAAVSETANSDESDSGYGSATVGQASPDRDRARSGIQLVVLGIAQDGGYPQAGCRKSCCEVAWRDTSRRRFVASIAIIDHTTGQRWLFDCTPDFRDQLELLNRIAPTEAPLGLDGILLTHAHIGHYTGLMHLGHEAMGARDVPVFAMPRMRDFLTNNGPWSQLVTKNNIAIRPLEAGQAVKLNERIEVTPLLVPHRDEYSETVAFHIVTPDQSVLYLPDIDKWSRWDNSIEDWIARVDLAFIDGTFFENGEIPGRDMADIPHPFVAESIQRFSVLDESTRKRVRFIHLNHTNPAIRPDDPARRAIQQAGMAVAEQGDIFDL